MKARARRFRESERGASLVEYALLVALIAVVCIGAVTLLGGAADENFSEVSDGIGGAGAPATTAAPAPAGCASVHPDGYATATPGMCYSPTVGWYPAP